MQSLLTQAGFGLGASLRLDVQLTETAGRLSLSPGAGPEFGGGGGAGASSSSSSSSSSSLSAPPQPLFVFSSREDVSGEVKLTVLGGKRVEHAGVRVELKGVVELAGDKAPHEFVALAKELAPPGASQGMAALRFSFARAELPHESYVGVNARVRYFLRAVVASKGGFGAAASLVKELDFAVQTVTAPLPPLAPVVPEKLSAAEEEQEQRRQQAAADAAAAAAASEAAAGASGAAPAADGALATPAADAGAGAGAGVGAPGPAGVKLEVGIEDCLHIEFVYDRTSFHLNDVVTGRVFFLLVRIKIKLMELALIRREAAGFPGAGQTESETLTRFEIMDGAPIRGERVPLRMLLRGLDLAPSLANVAGCLTVRYFLNLVLVDEEDRRYFKQQEVTLYRAQLGERERARPAVAAGGTAQAAGGFAR